MMLRRAMMAGASGGVTDPYWANVVSLLHLDGADGSTSTTDQKGKSWTFFGSGSALDTGHAAFGPSSLLLSGGGNSRVEAASTSTDFDLSGNYCAEGWIRPASIGNNAIITIGTSNSERITIGVSSTLGLYLYTASGGSGAVRISSGAGTVSTGVWRHFAATKDSGVWWLFLHGALSGTSSTTVYPSGSLKAYIGAGAVSDSLFHGHIDEGRFTKSVARYTSAFTAPTAPFPNS
ncbi:LamG domain-containing protein [Luteimonas sp. M1R5S18]|uniref:LamG domain-containing protein n=1 Tax=Luteimonas rhizosphaericola TaxID=3042024 RepID=A0ABT6JGJ0_9GAMM|nr:LamG domain-containing protein [Luteimonas rhizosphaericola]MDH5829795.1 LamG domain-containing protein [Luteimonas rhizosphaericola]